MDPPNYETRSEPTIVGRIPDDLSREVYCVLGIPIDAIGMPEVLRRIRTAASGQAPFLISTPNLNFLVNSQSDPDFRDSLLRSELCPADGMSIVWIARLIGVPIKHRIAGADVFDAMVADNTIHAKPLKVFFWGGAEGVAAAACRKLNARPAGLHCVGAVCPGFGSLDEMSRDDLIDRINASEADLLVVSLGARKGQLWLLRNHNRLHVPVRVHLGAVLNFYAGTVKRAPPLVQIAGLEWLWRIYQEPHLWKRYWVDGCTLLRLFWTRILPLAMSGSWLRLTHERQHLTIAQAQSEECVVLTLVGSATARHVESAVLALRSAIATQKRIVVDLTGIRAVDARFCGLLLMLGKHLKRVGAKPTLRGLSPRLERMLRLHGLGSLLTERDE